MFSNYPPHLPFLQSLEELRNHQLRLRTRRSYLGETCVPPPQGRDSVGRTCLIQGKLERSGPRPWLVGNKSLCTTQQAISPQCGVLLVFTLPTPVSPAQCAEPGCGIDGLLRQGAKGTLLNVVWSKSSLETGRSLNWLFLGKTPGRRCIQSVI